MGKAMLKSKTGAVYSPGDSLPTLRSEELRSLKED